MTWYVASMDGPTLSFPNREQAVQHLVNSNQDGRRRPPFKRIGYRLYEYTPPKQHRERLVTYYLGDRQSLEGQGFVIEH